MARGLGGEAEQQRRRQREVAGGDHADAVRARERVDLGVIRRRHPARADDDADPPFERRQDVRLDDGGVRVVDEHVRLDGIERLRDGREARRIRARDARDELQVVRRLDGVGDGAPVQPVIPATQTRIVAR